MKKTLLIADSDAEARERYLRFFMEVGYDVVTASDAVDCLEKIRDLQPAALLLDHDLRWGGYDGVLAWLREEQLDRLIVVILTVMTGYSQCLADSIRIPLAVCLPKPIALNVLAERAGRHRRVRRDAWRRRVERHSILQLPHCERSWGSRGRRGLADSLARPLRGTRRSRPQSRHPRAVPTRDDHGVQ